MMYAKKPETPDPTPQIVEYIERYEIPSTEPVSVDWFEEKLDYPGQPFYIDADEYWTGGATLVIRKTRTETPNEVSRRLEGLAEYTKGYHEFHRKYHPERYNDEQR